MAERRRVLPQRNAGRSVLPAVVPCLRSGSEAGISRSPQGATSAASVLTRENYITWILTMKNGIRGKTTPQPEAARAALRWYAETLPWFDLVAGVREALKGHE